MSSSEKRPFAEVLPIAEGIVDELRPYCERIEIAGSLRRKKEMIGDIEIVMIPQETEGLFGGSKRDGALLLALTASYRGWRRVKGGEWYQQYLVEGMTVDFFITTPEKWGCIFLIRTGSADFSRKVMTARSQGGLCPDHLKFWSGRLWDGDRALETPEEKDVFQALGLAFIAPEARAV
jgi:DNA polymerase (family 10)